MRKPLQKSPRETAAAGSAVCENKALIGKAYAPRVCELLDAARDSVLVFMFDWRWYKNDFSCDTSLVNQAMVRAVRRGVKVRALVNYSEVLEQLRAVGIECRKLNSAKLMHAKCLVVDGRVVVMGSHNLTENAMGRNIELSLDFVDEVFAAQLSIYHETLWSL